MEPVAIVACKAMEPLAEGQGRSALEKLNDCSELNQVPLFYVTVFLQERPCPIVTTGGVPERRVKFCSHPYTPPSPGYRLMPKFEMILQCILHGR